MSVLKRFNKLMGKKDSFEVTREVMALAEAGDLAALTTLVKKYPDVACDAFVHVSTAPGVDCLLTCPDVAKYAGNADNNRNALSQAVFLNNFEAAKALLEKSLAISRTPDEISGDKNAKTAFLAEILRRGEEDKIPVAKLLVEYGADFEEAKMSVDLINDREKAVINKRENCLAAVSSDVPAATAPKSKPPSFIT